MEKGEFSWIVKATTSRRGDRILLSIEDGTNAKQHLGATAEQRTREIFELYREEQEMGRIERAAAAQRDADYQQQLEELQRKLDNSMIEVEMLRAREEVKICSYCKQRGLGW